ncbi:MAPEG family protein, partial [bacterium]|nr:MAPEG family protein [bacterium]
MYIYPMAATVFYIFILGIFTFFVRAKAIRSKKLSLGYFKTHDLKSYEAPEHIVRFGRHFDNQFQVPILFMFTLLTAGIYSPNSNTIFGLAWFFLFTRIIH